ncbi:hypothetical protein HAX54_039109, partial [Datura stramonium]|nr:hypothetical protein [Datura stramonium]
LGVEDDLRNELARPGEARLQGPARCCIPVAQGLAWHNSPKAYTMQHPCNAKAGRGQAAGS